MTQPLPCPFCGGETVDEQSRRSGIYTGEKTNTWIYYISCIDCGAIGGLGKTEDHAIDLWNNRTPIQIVMSYDPNGNKGILAVKRTIAEAEDTQARWSEIAPNSDIEEWHIGDELEPES